MNPITIGITGAAGFLGWHLRVYLRTQPDLAAVCADRDTFSDPARLQHFVSQCDAIVHLAGVNRGEDRDVEAGNVMLARALVDACRAADRRPHVVFANSTHQSGDSAYGRSKRRASELIGGWSTESRARFTNVVLPHVFGEGGRPHYNSAVATFCHELATNGTPKIIHDGPLELIHAQRVATEIIAAVRTQRTGTLTPSGVPMRVSELLHRLQTLARQYEGQVMPRFEQDFDLDLFNTYRSYLFPAHYPVRLTQRQDARGGLYEAVKTLHGGQGFVSTTHPGITRGNHFHCRKIERFLVLQGEALIRVRRLFDARACDFRVSGTVPAYIDMPTFHTHDITNVGDTELVTLFWAHELFDPERPDTYTEKV